MAPPPAHKIVLVGASTVGKSSIAQRLVQGTFTDNGTTTCGADCWSYTCPVNSDQVKLQIWDTAGQERFRSISKSYFRNSVGAVLVYDITSLASFDPLGDWLNEFQMLSAPNSYVLLVGNKCDLETSREVSAELVKDFAETHHLEAIETSALSGMNIKEAFARMAFEVSTRVSTGVISVGPSPARLPQPLASQHAQKGHGCCK
jgi:small GTP-binding protein